MYCKLLEIAELDLSTNSCSTRSVVHPTWDDVHDAIIRLDKHSQPFVYLSPQVSEAERFSHDGQWLEIYGGYGDYWIAATIGEYFQRPLVNPNGDDSEIALWTSGQGFGALSKNVVHDLNIVLAVAKHYYDFGEFFPEVDWQR